MFKQKMTAGVVLAAAIFFSLQSGTTAFAGGKKKASFHVHIQNVSDKDGLMAADGSKYPFAVSPGLYSVTDAKVDPFAAGAKASEGLEWQAEDGNPDTLYAWVLGKKLGGSFGVFNKPVGSDMAGPLLPGGVYQFDFNAVEGAKLNLIFMYGQSNDLFYAPSQAIELFHHGVALSGDITDKLELWDAGTEVNEAPGIGPNQAPRQAMKNTGTDENGVVGPVKDGFTYPNTKDVLRITITAN
jgi:hypothetical protein